MSEDRCELTELLKRDCAHCVEIRRHTPPPQTPSPLSPAVSSPFRTGAPPPPVMRGYRDTDPPTVEAQYEGRCSHCGDQIEIGDRIRSDEAGGWLGECCND